MSDSSEAPTMDELREEVLKIFPKEELDAMQESVDEMLATPHWRQYVLHARLSLLDSGMEDLDMLIRLGVLRVDGGKA